MEAESAAIEALEARLEFWNGIHQAIQDKIEVLATSC
ncbi:MAG: hypothetical protein LAT76_10695 [Schleiferiaceae bacterium]|nr:hypothetical protein [Schleiferiaceae bacterium]